MIRIGPVKTNPKPTWINNLRAQSEPIRRGPKVQSHVLSTQKDPKREGTPALAAE